MENIKRNWIGIILGIATIILLCWNYIQQKEILEMQKELDKKYKQYQHNQRISDSIQKVNEKNIENDLKRINELEKGIN